jgi:hypothetical protein
VTRPLRGRAFDHRCVVLRRSTISKEDTAFTQALASQDLPGLDLRQASQCGVNFRGVGPKRLNRFLDTSSTSVDGVIAHFMSICSDCDKENLR